MNREAQQTRELLQLEIKLIRLKIAAAHLKRQKSEEKRRNRQEPLFRLLDWGSELATGELLQKIAGLPVSRKYRFGTLAALLAVQVLQNGIKRDK